MPRKRKLFFTISRIIVMFITGLVVAFVIALSQVNLETLRGNVLAILQGATGLPVQIDGSVSWKFSLRPRIELNQVRVPNADWAHHEYAFSAEKIDVTLNLISLFQSRPTIQNVKIYDATLCVEQNAQGEYSVMPFADKKNDKDETPADPTVAPEKPVQPKFPFADLGLGGVEVRNLVAHVLGRTYSLAGFNIRYMPGEENQEYSGWIKPTTDVYPFILSFSEYVAERRVYPVRLAFSTGGEALIADIALEGKSRMPIDFVVKGEIPDVAALGYVLDMNLDDVPALRVNLSGGISDRKFVLRKSSVIVRDTEFVLSGNLDMAKKKPTFVANVESKRLNLMQVFPELYKGKRFKPNRKLNVFKDIPLFGQKFKMFNMDLRMEIDNLVVYRDLDIRDVDLAIKLNDGHARVDLGAKFAGGPVRLAANVDIDGEGRLFVQAGGVGRDMVVGELLHQIRIDDFISDLPMNMDLYVQANGRDLSELMQTVTGPVQLYSAGNGYAHSALVAYMYGTDFLTSLRHSIQDLFRSEKKYNQIKISCVALNAKLRDGVAATQNGFAAETNAINVRLAGDINLGAETINLALTTVPVRGLKLSLTGNVVNSMEITGNLAEPDIKISGAAMAGKVASATGIGLLLAPFTGGIGLVAGAGVGLLAGDLLENWLADDDPCETAMRRGAPARRDDPAWMDEPIEQLVEQILDKNN